MICPHCKFNNIRGMLFCGMCGQRIAQECTSCQAAMPFDYRFCGICGHELDGIVPEYSTPPASAAAQSKESQTQTDYLQQHQIDVPIDIQANTPAITGERRQATVLISDVKGSTQILEEIGSENWVDMMNQTLQIMGDVIYRFGGEVDQFRGDGLVAFFGAHAAHEDDPERAIMAALKIQSELDVLAETITEKYSVELLVRIGIHTGEIITASIGREDQHTEDTAMGGAVTFASRLEAAAEPRTVLVSENTYRLIPERFTWNALGEIQLRGLRQPLSVYQPITPSPETQQHYHLQGYGITTSIVGRESEIEAVENLIKRLREGIGGLLLISGEAGMGKSRLLFEVHQRVERSESLMVDGQPFLTWLQGRCRSYEQTLPGSMWIDMLQRWLGMDQWVSPEKALKRLRDRTVELWGEEFQKYYPYLAIFLSLPLEKEYSDQIKPLSAEGLRYQLFAAVRAWLESLSLQAPVSAIFTEVHWADETSLDLVKFCLPLILEERLLLVIMYRPDRSSPVWQVKHFMETEYFHRLTEVDLPPLTSDQSASLMNEMIGPTVFPPQIFNQILEKSEGNPYFLTELIYSLIEKGSLVRDSASGTWQTAHEEILLDLPDSLKSLLLARIDGLSPEMRRLLQIAAIIGPVFWFNILALLADDKTDLRTSLTELQRAQLISERGNRHELGREYAFNSSLIREAAYEGVLRAQKENLHQSVAAYLEQIVQENALTQYHGIVAYHFAQANDCQKELFHTMLAAEEALNIHASAEAIKAYQRAITLMNQSGKWDCIPPEKLIDEWLIEAYIGLGKTHFGLGETQEAEEFFRKAVDLGRQLKLSPSELTRLFYWLGDLLFWQEKHEESVRLGEEGLTLLGDNNKSLEAALMNQLVAVGSSFFGDNEKFIDFTLRTAGFIQDLSYTEELRPAFDHIIMLYMNMLKDLPETRRWLEIFREKAERLPDLRALGEYYGHKANLLFQEGKPVEAIPYIREAIAHFEELGDSKHASRAWRRLGICQLQHGAINEALESFRMSLKAAEVFDNQADYAIAYWYTGMALLCQGALDEALVCFDKTKAHVQNVSYLKDEWARSGISRIYLAQGRRSEAREITLSSLDNFPTIISNNPYQAYNILIELERSFDTPEACHEFIAEYRDKHPEVQKSVFRQWYLTPAELAPTGSPPTHHEVFQGTLTSKWSWIDPFGECSYDFNNGLRIRASNEKNFHHINHSAPRLFLEEPFYGDFTLQTICQPISQKQPAIGGLLIWLSKKYWFCLEIGARGSGEVVLRGFMNNHDLIFGRGNITAKETTLRLERRGHWLSAYCSEDGEKWFSAGGCELSTNEGLHLGIHAIGHINRIVYPGSYPEGTAIHFKEFWLWPSGNS